MLIVGQSFTFNIDGIRLLCANSFHTIDDFRRITYHRTHTDSIELPIGCYENASISILGETNAPRFLNDRSQEMRVAALRSVMLRTAT